MEIPGRSNQRRYGQRHRSQTKQSAWQPAQRHQHPSPTAQLSHPSPPFLNNLSPTFSDAFRSPTPNRQHPLPTAQPYLPSLTPPIISIDERRARDLERMMLEHRRRKRQLLEELKDIRRRQAMLEARFEEEEQEEERCAAMYMVLYHVQYPTVI
ncbi:hypothetical protein [Absidia glauca]|uniref:Uncharacterized protein n=1 Tax=Absidia glauca TaxID=4829 RepID=A0A168L8A5_ABSGL|nr:hypothetical protein [Absidia glauca]